MTRHLLLPFLLLPMLAWAECEVARADGTVNITVGRKATNCFNGAGFRESFLAGVNEGLAADDAVRAGSATRGARMKRRPVLAEHGTPQQAGRYYGQR